jgi:hypothetical protein
MKILITKLQNYKKVSIRRMMSHYWEDSSMNGPCWDRYPAGHIHTKDG